MSSRRTVVFPALSRPKNNSFYASQIISPVSFSLVLWLFLNRFPHTACLFRRPRFARVSQTVVKVAVSTGCTVSSEGRGRRLGCSHMHMCDWSLSRTPVDNPHVGGICWSIMSEMFVELKLRRVGDIWSTSRMVLCMGNVDVEDNRQRHRAQGSECQGLACQPTCQPVPYFGHSVEVPIRSIAQRRITRSQLSMRYHLVIV